MLQRPDVVTDLAAQLGVEVRQGLVEQEHFRAQHDCAGHGDALLLSARQLAGHARFEAAEPDEAECLTGLCRRFGAGAADVEQAEGDVVAHVEMREQRVGLEHHGDVAPRHRQPRHVLAVDQDLPAACHLQPRDQAQRGGLAAAGGSEQGDQRAGRDGE